MGFRRFLPAFFFILICAGTAHAPTCGGASPTWTAISASYTDCYNCTQGNASLVAGDTVNVPADTSEGAWTSPITLNVPIHWVGAGYVQNSNCISAGMARYGNSPSTYVSIPAACCTGSGTGACAPTEITSGLANTLIFNFNSSSSNCATSPEITGFLFNDTNTSNPGNHVSSTSQGMINVLLQNSTSGSGCGLLKIHDNAMIHTGTSNNNFMWIQGYIWGVVYLNIMDNTGGCGFGGQFVDNYAGTWGNDPLGYGDLSWQEQNNYTTAGGGDPTRILSIEGNLVINNSTSSGVTDASLGSREDDHHNTYVNGRPNTHGGMESTNNGRGRGFRIKRVHNDVITGPANGSTCSEFRGSTGMFYEDAITGYQANCIKAFAYRYTNTYTSDPLVPTTGICWPYNVNDGSHLYEGEHYMCDKSFSGSQHCCNGTGSYETTCVSTTACAASANGCCNNDTANPCLGPIDNTDGSGSSGITGVGPWCRDGIGRGLETTLLGTQASEPLFAFSNTGASATLTTTDAVLNADYFVDYGGSPGVIPVSGFPGTCTSGKRYWNTLFTGSNPRTLQLCGAGNSWTVIYVEPACPNTLTGLTGHCTSVAGFLGYNVSTAPPTYAITVTSPTNGAILPGTTTVNSGNSLTCTITPATGYQLTGITVDGVPVGGWIPGAYLNYYTLTNITATHTIAATFGLVVPTVANLGTAGTLKNMGTAGSVENMQ